MGKNVDWADIGYRYRAVFPIPLVVLLILFSNPNIFSLVYGSIFVLLGLALRSLCAGYLGVKSRDEVPNTANLITTGPYKFSRNPVYIANSLIAFGLVFFAMGNYGLYLSLLISLFSAFIYLVFYNYFVVPAEEKFLEGKFGENYLNYKRVVPRWLINFKPIEERGRFRILPILRAEYWTWIIIVLLYLIIIFKSRVIKI
jgi:protein-S-isoprenylcysteine O-methyltransferase Ste14